ncbi:unnamed protein product, partial [Meganyctiphanes norvegica]
MVRSMTSSSTHHCVRPITLNRLLLAVLLQGLPLHALHLGECSRPLGMESYDIKDEAIQASSYHNIHVGPANARLNTDRAGGAWCPKATITSVSREYLEVDLGSVHVVTGTATQGRFANNMGQEYAEAFHLEYWRPGMDGFTMYRNKDNK